MAVPGTALSVNEDGESIVTIIKDNKAIQTTVELAEKGEPDIRADGFVTSPAGCPATRWRSRNSIGLNKDTKVTEVVEEKKAEDPD